MHEPSAAPSMNAWSSALTSREPSAAIELGTTLQVDAGGGGVGDGAGGVVGLGGGVVGLGGGVVGLGDGPGCTVGSFGSSGSVPCFTSQTFE
jgi:hypothetical protein